MKKIFKRTKKHLTYLIFSFQGGVIISHVDNCGIVMIFFKFL